MQSCRGTLQHLSSGVPFSAFGERSMCVFNYMHVNSVPSYMHLLFPLSPPYAKVKVSIAW